MISEAGSRPALAVGFLKLDTNLPVPGRHFAPPPPKTEPDDENTALAHKLDELEKRLVLLQKRNAEMQTRLQNPQPVSPGQPPWPDFSNWILWASALSALILAGAAFAWLVARRSALSQTTPRKPQATTESSLPPTPLELMASSVARDTLNDEIQLFIAQKHIGLAIQRLEDEIRHTPRTSPVPWLLLLNLLRLERKAERYSIVRKACIRRFNINVPDYEGSLVNDKNGLESYPQVISRLASLWPGEETASYLDWLLRDTRRGLRSGFDLQSVQDIIFLRELLTLREIGPTPANHDFPKIRGLQP